ncbi:DEAD/DEAH box helicase family protein [Lentibacillus sp. CBA3610]|uniref:TOTE conflict system archaeo-eukaryotic primase domain-containing protein n=1 Tax=Lentibacillus sp. CBA3610 TaxID=2518176 RepID=UPI0015951954|nr:DEAD/DEAH box helicase [Lentibacillus sp. CBA3610]QKY70107.1 DEAD/DEAH box helicase [Lentibacillus sp. CBA3610]
MGYNTEDQLQQALKEIERLRKENTELRQTLQYYQIQVPADSAGSKSKTEKLNERIHLFRSLFRGRDDVFAYRWEMSNEKTGYSPARKNNQFLPVSNQVIYDHLTGEKTIGVYPVLCDNSCWFLVVDFDKKNWKKDMHHFVQTCKTFGLPAYTEVSRSGNGCHVWIFFQESIKAQEARKLGQILLNKTKETNGQKTLESYDRMFPNQDTVPDGKLGNLVALPLQAGPRKQGNSVFVDEQLQPYPNQWAYLSQVKRVQKQDVVSIVAQNQELFVVKEKLGYGYDEKMPEEIDVHTRDGIYIPKKDLPQKLIQEIARLATFYNPEFYKAEKKRLSTKRIPRIIDCSDETDSYLILPRGCMYDLKQLLDQKSIKMNLNDKANYGETVDVEFNGTLSIQQEDAVQKLVKNHTGILSAATGFGKTVVAASLIAKRKVNTLVIVHRKHLMDQWYERLNVFLNMDAEMIGRIGGGKNTAKGNVDIATIQSLKSGGYVKDIVKQYGQIIVDECHHISAVSFEKVLKVPEAAYVYGLTATPKRKDGHDPIIRMQLGPIRYKISAKELAKVRPMKHILIPRYTSYKSTKQEIQPIYSEIVRDKKRNEMIFNDVLNELEDGAAPIVLTERIEHVQEFESVFSGFVKKLIVLTGELNKKEERERLNKLAKLPDDAERLIIATGKYIGEGFDNKLLDTMFLTMPVSWEGILQQYVGRMHRLHERKTAVKVYDYVDHQVPMLARMFNNRKKGYKRLGYVNRQDSGTITQQMNLF